MVEVVVVVEMEMVVEVEVEGGGRGRDPARDLFWPSEELVVPTLKKS